MCSVGELVNSLSTNQQTVVCLAPPTQHHCHGWLKKAPKQCSSANTTCCRPPCQVNITCQKKKHVCLMWFKRSSPSHLCLYCRGFKPPQLCPVGSPPRVFYHLPLCTIPLELPALLHHTMYWTVAMVPNTTQWCRKTIWNEFSLWRDRCARASMVTNQPLAWIQAFRISDIQRR